MKNTLLLIASLLVFHAANAQITITAADMPVAGDTLRYSFASITGAAISPGDSGANITWNYPLAPTRQAVDSYQTAFSVNPLYVATIGLTAYGYKVADSSPIPIPLPGVSIRQIYTFFEKKTTPARYQAEAFAANISGLPAAFTYSTPDVWYFFPLNYMRSDSSNYALTISIPALGSIKQIGYRKTRADGWGTITTPYYTTGVNCIRVRSEIHEIDSISVIPIPIPRNTVEYKWLVNGDHYPALWVTSTLSNTGAERITNIRYRDSSRVFADSTAKASSVEPGTVLLTAFPNPATEGIVNIQLPAGWDNFQVEIFDMNARQVAVFDNKRELDIRSLAAGQYVCRVISGLKTGYVLITR